MDRVSNVSEDRSARQWPHVDGLGLAQLLAFGTTLGDMAVISGSGDWRSSCVKVPIDAVLSRISQGYGEGTINPKRIGTLLKEIVADYVGHSDVLVPLSGGIDSRILLACLTKVISIARIHTVTFGESLTGVEVTLASDVCRVLGLHPPEVHLLKPETYKTHAPLIAKLSHGEIPPSHVHLLSFLVERGDDFPKLLLSGFGADAAAGYAQEATQGTSASRGLDSCAPAKTLTVMADRLKMSERSMASLRRSLEASYRRYVASGIRLSFAEYFYWSERTNRTFLGLAHLYDKIGFEVVVPFLNVEIFSTLACLKPQQRDNKRILLEVLGVLDPRLLSVPFFSSSAELVPRGAKEKLRRFAANRSRLAVEMLSRDRLSSPDPWQCEPLGRTMRKVLLPALRPVLREWQQEGLISETTASVLSKRHYRMSSGIIQAQYAALGVALAPKGDGGSGVVK